MCLAIPGRVVRIDTDSSPLMGKVRFGDIQKDVCLEWVPEVKVGEYVIVHVGFALSTLDEGEALETISMIEEMEKSAADPAGKEGD